MDDDLDEDYQPPRNTNTFALPNDPDLLMEYELYKPDWHTQILHTERNREVYAEAFIEHKNLGTLADLCVRSLAKLGTRYIAPQVRRDPMKLRIHYDSLDVNLPLQDCYFVEDLRFWRRVVLAKTSDKSLEYKKLDEYDWRGKGTSLKYVELVESCPANYWPEQKMAALGSLVRPYVRTLHIKHLQCLPDSAFKNYLENASELDVTSEELDETDVSSDEKDTPEESEEGEEEEDGGFPEPEKETKKLSVVRIASQRTISIPKLFGFDPRTTVGSKTKIKIEPLHSRSSTIFDPKLKSRAARQARNDARQQLRNLKREKQIEHERRRQQRALLREIPEPEEKPKKKTVRKKLVGVFDMEVPPEEDDGEDKILDKRNKKQLLTSLKNYNYPAKHCHHIDLSFIRYFDMLVSLTLEFLGPEKNRDYQNRHLNFSYQDIVHLSKGLLHLPQIKIFRLRNSRMDHLKLCILVRSLKQLDSLETVDFGFDQLADDCCVGLEMLLDRNIMLKHLELEYNRLEKHCLESLGYALKCHFIKEPDGRPLEYLGLAHNPIGDYGLHLLINDIIGTNHVQELNINGVEIDPGKLVDDINILLRNHTPLRRLDMAAINLNPTVGRELICGLESNHNIIHFDCRCCDLDSDEETEADIIVRRNNYEADTPYLGDNTQTEESLREYLSGLRHPIVAKIESNMARRKDCVRTIPVKSPSIISSNEEVQEEQEQEYDIWKEFGVNKEELRAPTVLESSTSTIDKSRKVFDYNPKLFNLQQLREHMKLPGPPDRYYYFQRDNVHN